MASKRRKILGADEYLVTAYAESASGPGWSNSPVWLVIMDGNKKLRQECLQPDEQTRDIVTLYAASAAIHGSMRAAAWRAVRGEK